MMMADIAFALLLNASSIMYITNVCQNQFDSKLYLSQTVKEKKKTKHRLWKKVDKRSQR